ncbi:TPA: hypothetical protein ENX78_05040 [Candidatus Poribacteria bacterium]|nr:hypothetical protein [Candidatus Poribacteria bacterium]
MATESAESICSKIHSLLDLLPLFTDPSLVPFIDGLYFFYEKGESSFHGPEGRVVRVGNHPRSDGNLIGRLRQHYFGNKNASVFRKFLGGALLRAANQNHPCLSPGPGLGHWEKQDARTCERCQPVEVQVSALFQSRFKFRCVEIVDRHERNKFEALLIASLATCSVCRPTAHWIGLSAYSSKIHKCGLWNSQHVNGMIMNSNDIQRFAELVKNSYKKESL